MAGFWSGCVCSCRSVVSDSLRPHGPQPVRLLCPWNFPGKNTQVSCHFPLQGLFPPHGLNPRLLCLLHWQADFLPLNHQGGPYIQISYINFSRSILCLLFCPQFSELGKSFNLQFVIYIYSIGFLKWCSGKPKKKFYLKNICS